MVKNINNIEVFEIDILESVKVKFLTQITTQHFLLIQVYISIMMEIYLFQLLKKEREAV
jgi:hypothetical protein